MHSAWYGRRTLKHIHKAFYISEKEWDENRCIQHGMAVGHLNTFTRPFISQECGRKATGDGVEKIT